MGKEGPRSVVHQEAYQRINFLFQAAHLCLQQSPDNIHMCRFYIRTLRSVAEKHVIRLHPDIKRKICKKCCLLLIPGVTALVRHKKKGEKCTVVTCLGCRNIKRFLWRKTHQLWVTQPEAWLQS